MSSNNLSRWLYYDTEEDDKLTNDQELENQSILICAPTTHISEKRNFIPETKALIVREMDENKQLAILNAKPKIEKVVRKSTAKPELVWEKKLAESLAREKQAQSEILELKRKLASLEERVRAVKNQKKREEKIQSETLEHKIATAVCKIVQDKQLSLEVREKIADAVASAVAQTLLSLSAPIAPPKRLPPSAPAKSTLQLT